MTSRGSRQSEAKRDAAAILATNDFHDRDNGAERAATANSHQHIELRPSRTTRPPAAAFGGYAIDVRERIFNFELPRLC